jgi:cell division protein FtsN
MQGDDMNGKDDFKQSLLGLLFLVLVVGIIVVGVWQFRMRRRAPAEQVGWPTLEKEVITPEAKEPEEVVKEILETKTEGEPQPEEKVLPKLPQKPFTIQVASFQDRTKAEIVVKELGKAGFSPIVSATDLGEKGVWYRVCVGDFDSEDEADEFLKTLKKDYKDSFIKLR